MAIPVSTFAIASEITISAYRKVNTTVIDLYFAISIGEFGQ